MQLIKFSQLNLINWNLDIMAFYNSNEFYHDFFPWRASSWRGNVINMYCIYFATFWVMRFLFFFGKNILSSFCLLRLLLFLGKTMLCWTFFLNRTISQLFPDRGRNGMWYWVSFYSGIYIPSVWRYRTKDVILKRYRFIGFSFRYK